MSTTESNTNGKNRPPATIPVLPPAAIDKRFFLTELTAAHSAIGELRGFLGTLQNPSLLIAPFRKREAVASSAIEGTRATLDEVMEYEAADNQPGTDNSLGQTEKVEDILEIMNYERAMSFAVRSLRDYPIGERLIKETHRILLQSVRGSTKTPGEFRRAPVAVGEYVPPASGSISGLMTNWENYLNKSKVETDPLVRIAVAHYQFEAIHPFMDGNGRIGRLIIPLFLCQEGLLDTPVLYVSHYLERYKVEYGRLLHEVDTDQKWNEWIRFFLLAIQAQARITTAKAKEIQELYERLKVELAQTVRSQHFVATLDLLFSKAIVSAPRLNKAIHAKSRATANNIINRLVEAGVLRKTFSIGNEKFYEFTELRKIIRS